MKSLAVTAALLACAFSSRAACATTCPELPTGATMQKVEYFSGPPTQPGDHKCTKDGKRCSLSGWLYVPQGLSKTPNKNHAVIFLHGHHRERSEPCAIAYSFLAAGWVVFAPLRSGHTGPGINNTGKYIDDWAEEQGGPKDERRVEYLRKYQIHDVEHAIDFLARFKFDGNKQVDHIAVMGHSFGGALAVFSSAESFKRNPEVTADIQGAELSWGDDGGAWKEPLLDAVKHRKMPIFFLQPSNGQTLKPTMVLSEMAALSGNHQYQAAIFPPVVAAPDDVHGDFVTKTDPVFRWAPVVRDFFERYMH
ncbi:alpha/beta fold hydrolase [Pyxidicoccus parkwayensis]|uniref:Alpha/beta fold hydrolase n=1 Tax=Pyxidicoccus parkwayensis TaxID=2813578 RepID=A0ABX7P656_9BACT|nr:alpha/beta fold hydrolase [Pyxidicoccus parkwaysis]QSQ25949.1 alpha/beta fold hydrolase [Pyxidicoccus parkwaysis]